MPEPMQYPTPTLDDSHRLIRERASFASLADMRKHIEAQAMEIEQLNQRNMQLSNDLHSAYSDCEKAVEVNGRLSLRIDNTLRILSGENSWLALVMAAKEELEKARGGF